MKFKLPIHAHLFIHFLRQVFHLKCEISSIDWSFLKHLCKLQIDKISFTKSLFLRSSSTLSSIKPLGKIRIYYKYIFAFCPPVKRCGLKWH